MNSKFYQHFQVTAALRRSNSAANLGDIGLGGSGGNTS